MAGPIVEMDYPTVLGTSQAYRERAANIQTQTQVGVALFDLAAKFAIFPAAVAYYTRCKELVARKGKLLSDTLIEFSENLAQAVQDHKDGDYNGKEYFGRK